MQKRMIYFLQMPDVALAPGQPLGTISGRGTLVPAVNCPKPNFGDRSPLMNCLECTHCKAVEIHSVDCEYTQTAQERGELERRRGGPPMPQPPQGQAPPQVEHPAIAPPVPPNVFKPK